ncbi:MAG TPA: thioredoxin [Terriglobales bacterium]|nr:thioredoxin [Terriglobales bacterium]
MNNEEFQQTLSQTSKPVIVDFWANWCVPCRITKPILESLADEYADQIEFLPINADDSREVLEQFQVIGIPTVLSFRDGKMVGRVTGAQNVAGYRILFNGLAEGKDVRIPLTPFNRMLRLGAGGFLIAVGIFTGSWLVAGAGTVLAFLGIYDRCPIWAAVTRMIRRKEN